MIDEKNLIEKLECIRWKMARDTTPMQSLEVKFGNEMLDMVLDVIKNMSNDVPDINAGDCISRKAVLELIESKLTDGHLQLNDDIPLIDAANLMDDVSDLPNNQPQVQQIVRTPEEIVYHHNCEGCSARTGCYEENKQYCEYAQNEFDWLLGKQVE